MVIYYEDKNNNNKVSSYGDDGNLLIYAYVHEYSIYNNIFEIAYFDVVVIAAIVAIAKRGIIY